MTLRKALIDLASEHAAWTIPSACLEAIRLAFGSDWNICEIGSANAAGTETTRETPDDVNPYEGVEVYFGWGIPRTVVTSSSDTLKWAHTGAAGVGGSINDALRSSGAVVTNSRGIHAEPISDWVIAAIGFCIRGFHDAVAAQREHNWTTQPFMSSEARLTEFSSLRVGVVGLGGIGTAVARKCHALGMEVRAVRRRVSSSAPSEVLWVGGPDGLPELAAQSDVLVLTVPHTAATTKLIDAAVLRALPRGAYLLNVSRGGILDETALLKTLEAGHIRGCVLDVFANEPLEKTHPFWDEQRVLITPHVSAVSDRVWEREIELIVENIGRFLQGQCLKNVVNLEAGY